jgi:tRNA threonylcarbamoyladenosine biosynthesis protein TsaE
MIPLEIRCADVEATRAVGAVVAGLLEPGDLVLLDGELGAGKTTFVQGMAVALGVADPVTSPTFTLVDVHPTKAGFDLLHVDVYRLEHLHEVVDLAIPEALDEGAVAIVEWGSRALGAFRGEHLRVALTIVEDDGVEDDGVEDSRVARLDSLGDGWARRWEKLISGLEGS